MVCRKESPFVGSASLIGGHGTTIAWAPIIFERFGLANALEVGIATATLGLVVASLVGGPIAGLLISRHNLAGPWRRPGCRPAGRSRPTSPLTISAISASAHVLVLNMVILIGFALDEVVAVTGVKLPLFVVCLLVGIVVTNTVPRVFPGSHGRLEPARWRWSPICRSTSSWRCR